MFVLVLCVCLFTSSNRWKSKIEQVVLCLCLFCVFVCSHRVTVGKAKLKQVVLCLCLFCVFVCSQEGAELGSKFGQGTWASCVCAFGFATGSNPHLFVFRWVSSLSQFYEVVG